VTKYRSESPAAKMKFIPIAIAFLSTLAIAAPSPEGELEKRQCTCKKVGDEWICTGKKWFVF